MHELSQGLDQDCQQLQEDMEQLAVWESKWEMAFHPDKCSFMRISRSRSPIQFKYHLKTVELQVVDSIKYLGVDISSTLSWNQHIDRTVKKANSILHLYRNLRISNRVTKSSAYFSLVRPNLEYCSTVWSPHTKTGQHKVLMVQRRTARYVASRYRNTSSVTDMLEELEWSHWKVEEFPCYLHHIAFDRLKSHTPFPCPASQLIYIFLKFQCVFSIHNFSVANTVIRNESYFRINVC